MDNCHLRLFPVLMTCSVCAVFLAQTNLDGSTHDQRGRDGFFAAGESVLYPFGAFLVLFWLIKYIFYKGEQINKYILTLRNCGLVISFISSLWCLLSVTFFLNWLFYMAIVNPRTSCKLQTLDLCHLIHYRITNLQKQNISPLFFTFWTNR